MQYITKIHALNLPCNLKTCGDWHQSALRWEKICMKDSSSSVFGTYGIEAGKKIPNHAGIYFVANHIRALLDMLDDGDFADAQGMKNDFICNDQYTNLIFEKTLMLQNNPNWKQIYQFMHKEYGRIWRIWTEKNMAK